jgi:hypothetical protein
LSRSLAAVRLYGGIDEFEALLTYVENVVHLGKKSTYNLFLDVYHASAGFPNPETILKDIIDRFGQDPAAWNIVRLAYRDLLALQSPTDENIARLYLSRGEEVIRDREIDGVDYLALYNVLDNSIIKADPKLIESALALIEKLRGPADIRLRVFFALILFRAMEIRSKQGSLVEANQDAREILELLDAAADDPWIQGLKGILTSLRQAAENHLKIHGQLSKPEKTRRTSLSIGRNHLVRVRYASGKIVTKKYKLVQRDIVSGVCDLVEVVGPQS